MELLANLSKAFRSINHDLKECKHSAACFMQNIEKISDNDTSLIISYFLTSIYALRKVRKFGVGNFEYDGTYQYEVILPKSLFVSRDKFISIAYIKIDHY